MWTMTRPRSLLLSSTTKNRSRSPDTLALFITSLNSFLEGIALLILKKKWRGQRVVTSQTQFGWLGFFVPSPTLTFTLRWTVSVAVSLSLLTKLKSSAKSDLLWNVSHKLNKWPSKAALRPEAHLQESRQREGSSLGIYTEGAVMGPGE